MIGLCVLLQGLEVQGRGFGCLAPYGLTALFTGMSQCKASTSLWFYGIDRVWGLGFSKLGGFDRALS